MTWGKNEQCLNSKIQNRSRSNTDLLKNRGRIPGKFNIASARQRWPKFVLRV